ncbi:MAG TPA: PAS domain-containing sensor histidine kinase [Bacteroidales bacterium]
MSAQWFQQILWLSLRVYPVTGESTGLGMHNWFDFISDLVIGFTLLVTAFTMLAVLPGQKMLFRLKSLVYPVGILTLACGAAYLSNVLFYWYQIHWLSVLIRTAAVGISVAGAIQLITAITELRTLGGYAGSGKLTENIPDANVQENKKVPDMQKETRNENYSRSTTGKSDKQEIFEQAKRELQIKESEERFRSLVESSPNAIVLTDQHGLIRLVNRQTEVLFGYERSELIGKPIETMLPERFRTNHLDHRDSFYRSPQTRPMGIGRDLFGLHKKGHEIPVEIGLTPLRSQDKLMILSTIVDITERKRNEEKLLQKNEELERFNEELKARTAQLVQSEKMSALGTLIAGVAHELNNPITGILNYSQYCRRNVPQDGKLVEVLDDLIFEAKRCAEIVSNLLTYSYVSSGISEKEIKETANVNDVIKRVCTIFAHLLKNIDLSVETEKDLPPFHIQANKLQQVVSNILKNSIDAIESRTDKEIRIQAFQDSDQCHLIIGDNGTGIPEDVIPKIFDPFYTTKDVGKGTGLGLSVCKSIVEEYDGKISLETEINKGTRFHITFPKR